MTRVYMAALCALLLSTASSAQQPDTDKWRKIPLTIKKLPPGARPLGRRVLKPETTETMLELLRLNVLKGTGTNANAEGLRVGGKTGSAQKAMNGHYEQTKLVSSFAGVFPADGPIGTKRYFVMILVDEPVAGMTPQETERTAELLLSLRDEHSVIVVEHDMDFVRSIARRVTPTRCVRWRCAAWRSRCRSILRCSNRRRPTR